MNTTTTTTTNEFPVFAPLHRPELGNIKYKEVVYYLHDQNKAAKIKANGLDQVLGSIGYKPIIKVIDTYYWGHLHKREYTNNLECRAHPMHSEEDRAAGIRYTTDMRIAIKEAGLYDRLSWDYYDPNRVYVLGLSNAHYTKTAADVWRSAHQTNNKYNIQIAENQGISWIKDNDGIWVPVLATGKQLGDVQGEVVAGRVVHHPYNSGMVICNVPYRMIRTHYGLLWNPQYEARPEKCLYSIKLPIPDSCAWFFHKYRHLFANMQPFVVTDEMYHHKYNSDGFLYKDQWLDQNRGIYKAKKIYTTKEGVDYQNHTVLSYENCGWGGNTDSGTIWAVGEDKVKPFVEILRQETTKQWFDSLSDQAKTEFMKDYIVCGEEFSFIDYL